MKTFTFKKNFAPLWLAAFMVVLVGVLSLTQPNSETWVAWCIVGVLAMAFTYGFFFSHAKIDSSQLYIQADLSYHKIKLEDIAKITQINLKLEPTLHARIRTFGTSFTNLQHRVFYLSE